MTQAAWSPSDNTQASVRATNTAIPVSDEVRNMEIAQTVQALFYRARDARRPLMAQWKKNYKVLNNRTWTNRSEPWMPAPEISNIWPLVASMVSWMTDQRPGCEVSASAPPFSEFADYYNNIADQMNSILDSQYAENMEDAEIEKILWDVCTYSVGYSKVTWEPWLADGLGDAAMRRVDPATLYPDPNAHSMDQANYIVEAKIMSMNDLDRAFPGAASKVQPGMSMHIDESPHRLDQTVQQGQPRVNMGPLAPNTQFTTWQQSPRAASSYTTEDPVVVVLEAWIRTHRIIDHHEDKSLQPGTARVIDRWKCVVVVNNTVLMDKYADEIYAFTTHPYSKMVLFDTGEWYGPCLVEFLTSPQESINRMLQTIEHNLLLLGNPILLEQPKANIGGRPSLSNRPGQRVLGNKQTTGFMDPPVIHPDFMKLIEYYEGKMEVIAGMYAIMRGAQQGGARQSSDVVSNIQDSAFVRVRATLRNLERLLRDAANKKCAIISEFYTEPRLVHVLGAKEGNPIALALRANHFYNLPGTMDMADGDMPVPMRFKVRADAGSDHPTSRQSRQAQMERLFALGTVDIPALLQAESIPGWKDIAGRVMQQQAQQGVLGQPPGARQRTRAQ